MKKLFYISSFFFLLTSFTISETYVYVCNSTGSTRYHLKKDCRGLKPCKATIKKVTKVSAEKVGRTLCKWED